jgi:hypothetical protein
VADPDVAPDAALELAPVPTLEVKFRPGNTTDRGLLDSLDVASYDNVIVMCYSDTLDVLRRALASSSTRRRALGSPRPQATA